jgi:hypothetical protein
MKQKMALIVSATLNRLRIDYQNPRWWFDVLVIAISYYVTSWLVLKKMPVSAYGTPVWPATGFAIGLLLLWGRSRWLGVFLGATLANYIGIKPLILAACGGAGNTLGSLLSVTLTPPLVNPCSTSANNRKNKASYSASVNRRAGFTSTGAEVGFLINTRRQNLLSHCQIRLSMVANSHRYGIF